MGCSSQVCVCTHGQIADKAKKRSKGPDHCILPFQTLMHHLQVHLHCGPSCRSPSHTLYADYCMRIMQPTTRPPAQARTPTPRSRWPPWCWRRSRQTGQVCGGCSHSPAVSLKRLQRWGRFGGQQGAAKAAAGPLPTSLKIPLKTAHVPKLTYLPSSAHMRAQRMRRRRALALRPSSWAQTHRSR